MNYAKYLEKHIFEPLKMHNSYVDDGSNKPDQAIGYTFESDTFSPAKPYEMSWPIGAGNIRSTAEDLYLFNQALHSDNLLNQRSWELMRETTVHTDWNETLWNGTLCGALYGYGLIITPATHNREATLGHGGGIGAFTAESIRFMPSDVHLIVLSNHDTIESYAKKFFSSLEQIIFKNHA
jgi:CubicO group peptidase (beta-lactamase class C family)